ncbi:MAG: N-carbamoylputrescine amidase [Clostridiales bacterium]|jgi:N-carbamoylputrescine amidase|nr:N-carbamoylputrescine amidase [Eubacteriales bacterium]MDH7565366.1 N-carbamoylputrescine amidase [Clostridiales bacterium]
MRKVIVAATQMGCSRDVTENIAKAEELVRSASQKGAGIILLQELFEMPYFCQKEELEFYRYASELERNRAVNHFKPIARKLKVVLPISFYEKKNNARYNSVAVIDADGEILGVYRKTHIPDGPGYEEKYYFNPGDTGFKVWNTRYGKIGVGVCWDQWFPESARCMALMGAEVLLYPTAIGSEPGEPGVDSKNHWQICMQGHAAANIIPVVASNRIGTEHFKDSAITFYGSSFITDHKGEIVAQADRTTETVLLSEFDLDEIEMYRASWGVFRDRRPEMYKLIMTCDGDTNGDY